MPHDIDLNALIRERAPHHNLRVRVETPTGTVLLTTTFLPRKDEIVAEREDRQHTLRLIHDMVCGYFGLRTLRNAKRGRAVAHPRMIAMAISATYASTPEVGRFYKRDHSTVLHAMRQVKDNRLIIENAKKLAVKVEEVLSGKGAVQ